MLYNESVYIAMVALLVEVNDIDVWCVSHHARGVTRPTHDSCIDIKSFKSSNLSYHSTSFAIFVHNLYLRQDIF